MNFSSKKEMAAERKKMLGNKLSVIVFFGFNKKIS